MNRPAPARAPDADVREYPAKTALRSRWPKGYGDGYAIEATLLEGRCTVCGERIERGMHRGFRVRIGHVRFIIDTACAQQVGVVLRDRGASEPPRLPLPAGARPLGIEI